MKLKITNKYIKHEWFAWYPVVVENKEDENNQVLKVVEYSWVWLEYVIREAGHFNGYKYYEK